MKSFFNTVFLPANPDKSHTSSPAAQILDYPSLGFGNTTANGYLMSNHVFEYRAVPEKARFHLQVSLSFPTEIHPPISQHQDPQPKSHLGSRQLKRNENGNHGVIPGNQTGKRVEKTLRESRVGAKSCVCIPAEVSWYALGLARSYTFQHASHAKSSIRAIQSLERCHSNHTHDLDQQSSTIYR